MTSTAPRSFTAATEAFVNASPWLTDADQPALTTLYTLAGALDGGDLTPALVAQYGLAYRSLLKRAPMADDGVRDPLEEALRAAG